MTPTTSDPLAQRIADWAAQIASLPSPPPELALQGWALHQAVTRRGASAEHLIETVQRHLSPLPESEIPQQIERATYAFKQLLADLDATDDNFEHVRLQTRDVFFSVLEAFILAEQADSEHLLAQRLFNAIAGDLYVFESMADVAAELERPAGGVMTLCDLFCTGVAGLFDGEVGVRERVEVQADEFVPISAVVRGNGPAKPLTPAALEKRLAAYPFWFVKWVAQRLTLAIAGKTGDLQIGVWNGESAAALTPSQDLNGWHLRISHGKDSTSGAIANGACTLKLPKRIDAELFTVQIKDLAGEDWIELFGRVEEQK